MGVATTSSTSPTDSASVGRIRRPVSSTVVSAPARPSIRTVRVTPPAPGSRPRVTSGSPSRLPGASSAIRWWQASAISRPPPSAEPLTAATTGRPSVSRRRRSRLMVPSRAARSGASARVARIISGRSPPAKKVDFALVTMTPTRSLSASSRSSTALIEAAYARFMVLADWVGSSRVSVTMPSAPRSYRMVLVIVVLRVSSARERWRRPCRRRCRGSPRRGVGRGAPTRPTPYRAASLRSRRADGRARSRHR
ncbi:hypothetical protein PSN01_01728 [Micromonospora saelicesensis]|nr:hypothetical protein PSN01_01728 [Micromonospora saelicesensis]